MAEFSNHLLQTLGSSISSELTAKGSLVALPFKLEIYDHGEPLNYVYFPEGCLFSLVRTSIDGKSVESGLCGYEGAVGLIEACGSRIATATTIVQVPGRAWRIPYMACADVAFRGGRAAQQFFTNAEYLSIEARQSAVCRSFHKAQHRMARWIVEYQRRSDVGSVLPVTHELLSDMLGVQRTTVSEIAAVLRDRGLISYARGKLKVLDQEGLERAACDCSQTLAEERARIRATNAR
jgi:CRP-like cAMP-binding protein